MQGAVLSAQYEIYGISCLNRLLANPGEARETSHFFVSSFVFLFCLFWYQYFYPHTSRDSVSPVCGFKTSRELQKSALKHLIGCQGVKMFLLKDRF